VRRINLKCFNGGIPFGIAGGITSVIFPGSKASRRLRISIVFQLRIKFVIEHVVSQKIHLRFSIILIKGSVACHSFLITCCSSYGVGRTTGGVETRSIDPSLRSGLVSISTWSNRFGNLIAANCDALSLNITEARILIHSTRTRDGRYWRLVVMTIGGTCLGMGFIHCDDILCFSLSY
jgi:hypothetical protein